MSEVSKGFHARDGWYFRREDNGSVHIAAPDSMGPGASQVVTLDADTWASVVASVGQGRATLELDRDVALKLIEAHRPVKVPHPETSGKTFLVQCRACDRGRWQVWAPGDPEYTCELWSQIRHLAA